MALSFVIGALACGRAGIAPGLDEQACGAAYCPAPGVIHGEVLYSGPARGDAILVLFDTKASPSPEGSGAGVAAVARIPEAVLFRSASVGGTGPFSAPFTFTQVRAGSTYRIRAFIDTMRGFVPFFDYAQQPRAGDPAGKSGDIAVAPSQVVTGVQVALTETMEYDPPSFEMVGGSRTLDTGLDRPVRLKLRIARLPVAGASFGKAHFALELDRDAQGNQRSSFGDGLDDVFPHVFLRQLTDGGQAAMAAEAAAVIPCRVISTAVLPALLDSAANAPPVVQDAIELLIEPLAFRPGESAPLARIPAGTYQVVVVQRSGQTWSVPNQLGDATNASSAWFAASQGESITFAPSEAPANSVSGIVSWRGDPSIRSGNIVVEAYRDDPYDLPPPLGAAAAARVQIIPAAAVVPDALGFHASYRIDGLPEGNYVIHALDDADANYSVLNLLRTPTSGDLAGVVLDQATRRHASIAVRGEVTASEIALERVTEDPPAFELDPATPAQMPIDRVVPLRFRVRTKPLAFPAGKAPAPHFAVQLIRDSTGAAVDADHDGLADVWPRVFLVRLDPSDPARLERYESRMGKPQAIPAAVDPTPFLPALLSQAQGKVLTDALEIVVQPALLESAPGEPPRRLPLQEGEYGIVLVSHTGQLWQIPNEAGSSALDPAVVCVESAASCAPGTVKTQSQSGAFRVTRRLRPPATGAIAGTLTTSASPAVAAYVFAYAVAAHPPFGTPVAVDFHPGTAFRQGSLDYLLPNLPEGEYLVSAIVDTRGDFTLSMPVLAMAAGAGDLVAPPVRVTVGTSVVLQDLAATVAMPLRPSFLVPSGIVGADIDLAFNGAPAVSILVQPIAILNPQVTPLQPDSAAGFALACGSDGKPLTDSLSLTLIKLTADATGLIPDLDEQGRATVLSGALEATPFASATCTPGRFYTVSTPVTVTVQRSSSAKVSLLDPAPAPVATAFVAGRYAFSVTSAARQTWRIPNELQLGLLDRSTLPATPADAQFLLRTQQIAVNVTP